MPLLALVGLMAYERPNNLRAHSGRLPGRGGGGGGSQQVVTAEASSEAPPLGRVPSEVSDAWQEVSQTAHEGCASSCAASKGVCDPPTKRPPA